MRKMNILNQLLLVVGIGTLSSFAHGIVRVSISPTSQFTPHKVMVKVGDSVEFSNESRGAHTVTADPKLAQDPSHVILPAGAATFHSGRLLPGAKFTQKFSVPGLYQYTCLPHEMHGMQGQVEVAP